MSEEGGCGVLGVRREGVRREWRTWGVGKRREV